MDTYRPSIHDEWFIDGGPALETKFMATNAGEGGESEEAPEVGGNLLAHPELTLCGNVVKAACILLNRTEITEDFIKSLKQVFAEHYIEVPEEKVDIVENLFDKVEELEEKLNSQIQENVKVKDELNDYRKNKILEEVCEDLADTQAEKMKSLVDGVTYEENADDFENKVKIVQQFL